jgi:hypothetical protein
LKANVPAEVDYGYVNGVKAAKGLDGAEQISEV